MKKLFLSAFIIFSFNIYSQNKNIETEILNDPHYQEVSKKSLEIYTSDTYINYEKINKDYLNKLPEKYFKDNPANFEEWIEKNLQYSKFKSKEEALLLHKNNQEAFLKLKEIEKDLPTQIIKLSDKYGRENFKKVYDEHILTKVISIKKENEIL